MPNPINQAEMAALHQAISNDARVLYILGLRPIAEPQSGVTEQLNYKKLQALLNGKETHYTLGRQINSLLKELAQFDLVAVQEEGYLDKSCNGKQITLPLFCTKQKDFPSLHLNWFSMTPDWQPHKGLFEDLATMVGIIDKAYSETELGEFIAYWMGRPQMQFSQYQWTQKFVFQIKRKRVAGSTKPMQKVGSQLVVTKAGIEADDNAKQLVAKYAKATNKQSEK